MLINGGISRMSMVMLKGPLEKIFDSDSARILDFLLIKDIYEYHISDVAMYSGVSTDNTHKIIDNLADLKIINYELLSKWGIVKISNHSAISKCLNKLITDITSQRIKKSDK